MAVDYYFVGQSAGNSSSGTITPAQFGPQNANTVLSGPTTGAAANPTFRALVANDIPSTLNATTFPSISFTNLTKLQDTANGTLQIAKADGTFGSLLLGAAGATTGILFTSQNGQINVRAGDNSAAAGVAANAFIGPLFRATQTGSTAGLINNAAVTYSFGFADNTHANIYTAGVSALSIDSSQNATFSTTVKWAGAATHSELAVLNSTTQITGTLSGATVTLAGAIPAGSIVVGVSTRVTTAITGATSFSIGDGTTAGAFGSAIAVASGTTTTNANWTISNAPVYAAGANIVLTANGGVFLSGVVRVTVSYIACTAPTS